MTWIFQLRIDEGSGTTLGDTGTGTAVDLTLSGGAWGSIAAGDGHTGVATRSAFGSGNKLYDESNGSTEWTWEIVADPGTIPEGFSLPIWWYDTTDVEHSFSIIFEGDGRLVALSENPTAGPSPRAESATGVVSTSTVQVFHAVWDQGNGTAADRLRIYRNGSRVTPSTAYEAPQGGIDTGGSGTQCELLLNSVFSDPSGGTLYWCAAADHAAADSEISSRATALLADNDTDPSGGGGEEPVVATPDHLPTLSFPVLCSPRRQGRWQRKRGSRLYTFGHAGA